MMNPNVSMKAQGSVIAFENGKRKHDVEMFADYDGKELEIDVNDVLHNKQSHIQLSNEDLFDIMIRKQPSDDLMTRLQKQLKPVTHSPKKSNSKQKPKKTRKRHKRNQKRKHTIRKHKKKHIKQHHKRKHNK